PDLRTVGSAGCTSRLRCRSAPADPLVDRRQLLRGEIRVRNDLLTNALGQHPPARRLVCGSKILELLGPGVVAEIRHQVRHKVVPEVRPLLCRERLEILLDEGHSKLRLLTL